MSWFRKIFQNSHERDDCRLLNLRATRFRQLLRNYGKILDRLADAAEKQSGEYVLDRQYIVSLAEVVIDLAESIIFDLNVIAENRHNVFYDVLGKFNNEIRSIVAAGSAFDGSASYVNYGSSSGSINPNRLSDALSSAQVLFRNEGQVACRGVAAGEIFNLETAGNASEFPGGAIMVAANIRPDDELIRIIKKASAILTDLGEPAGDAAILAREFQIPMIVGIEGASSRLETGLTITVDADENCIYLGRVQELLDYYKIEHLAVDEEPEYKLLRKLRQSMFLLTLTEISEPITDPNECRSLHDLVHFASELAGDALVELVANRLDLRRTCTEILTGGTIPVRIIDAGDGFLQDASDGEQLDLEKVRSLPLLTFVNGLKEADRYGAHRAPQNLSAAAVLATIKAEHANIILQQPNGHDIIDSLIGESKESNHIYCRFAARIHDDDVSYSRGTLAREILSRLNFAVARTPRASSAWIGGLPLPEMKERLAILGCLSAFLLRMDAVGGEIKALDKTVEDFVEQYA